MESECMSCILSMMMRKFSGSESESVVIMITPCNVPMFLVHRLNDPSQVINPGAKPPLRAKYLWGLVAVAGCHAAEQDAGSGAYPAPAVVRPRPAVGPAHGICSLQLQEQHCNALPSGCSPGRHQVSSLPLCLTHTHLTHLVYKESL